MTLRWTAVEDVAVFDVGDVDVVDGDSFDVVDVDAEKCQDAMVVGRRSMVFSERGQRSLLLLRKHWDVGHCWRRRRWWLLVESR